jgi:hypothetical protein
LGIEPPEKQIQKRPARAGRFCLLPENYFLAGEAGLAWPPLEAGVAGVAAFSLRSLSFLPFFSFFFSLPLSSSPAESPPLPLSSLLPFSPFLEESSGYAAEAGVAGVAAEAGVAGVAFLSSGFAAMADVLRVAVIRAASSLFIPISC